uniref:Minor capsid protein L2 n=1 Tax=Human papillomavirus TaxID=10566 RepID=A0A385PRU8_9PAPI|nr:MAG: L2 protein [Human papillomavirus]
MYRAKRQKRDTVENIYRQCKVAGNCPPDVVNKVEQTTLADILLKVFGSIIYLGGLGIGTGSGAGSATGFRPLPENIPLETLPTDTATVETPIVRPTRPTRPTTFGTRIDPISSAGNRPRPVNPQGPAIVPLSEAGVADPTVISSGAGPGPGINDFEVLTTFDTFEDTSTVTGHPTIVHAQRDIAVLDVTPIESIPHRIAAEYPLAKDVNIIESSFPAPDPINVFVDPSYDGIHIGEEIELEPINTIAEFEIEENIPRTSTPARILDTAAGRLRRLYSRFVEQAPTRNVDFLGRPSRAILFQFENPAFSDDITLTFERDLEEIAAAPDPTFTDVIQLDRPQWSTTDQDLVRYSRLGTRGKVSTRSGTVLRQKVHFYYDVSPIPKVSESIELQPVNDSSDAVTIVDELSRSTFINPVFEENIGEDQLLDELVESFTDGHLTLITEEEGEQIMIPAISADIAPTIFTGDYFSKYTVINSTIPEIPLTPNEPATPAVVIDPYSADFYLHPALMKRRKRKYSEIF